MPCSVLILAIGLQFNGQTAEPLDESVPPAADESLTKTIIPPAASDSLDDYLISLAKAGNANFIADVTSVEDKNPVQSFPASAMAQFYPWQPKYHLVMLDLTQEKRLALLRYSSDTYLFWPEPETETGTDKVATARKFVASFGVPSDKKLASATELFKLVSSAAPLAKEPDAGKEVEVQVAIKDLPQPQQSQALGMMKELVMDRMRSSLAWYDDSFWENAFVRITNDTHDGKTTRAMQVGGFYHGRGLGGSIIGLQEPIQ